MARTLTLKADRLTELTTDELADVVGAAEILSKVICLTDMITVCDAHRCAI